MVFVIVNSALAADTFIVDPEHTFVSFSYKHFNYSIQTSRFDNVTGVILFDKENNTGNIRISIDTKSISTGSVIFNKRIQEDDFFATDRFPIATFESDDIVFNNEDITSVQGKLTIKDITKPISIMVTNFSCSRNLLTLKYTCGANATAKLNRSDFDMEKYVPFVGNEMAITIAIEASR